MDKHLCLSLSHALSAHQAVIAKLNTLQQELTDIQNPKDLICIEQQFSALKQQSAQAKQNLEQVALQFPSILREHTGLNFIYAQCKKTKNLRYLNFRHESVTDLHFLQDMPLTELILEETLIEDITPLRNMKLELLCIMNTKVRDISPLKTMDLQEFHLDGSQVSDLSPLSEMSVKRLFIANTKVEDLSPIKDMPLESLHIHGCPLKDTPINRKIHSKSFCEGDPNWQ